MLNAQQKQDEYIKQLASKVDVLTTHNRMLEAQIAQKADLSSTPLDRLPSKPELNPREQLRGGKKLEGPKEVTNDESSHDKNTHVENVKKEMSSPSKEAIDDVRHKPDEVPKDLRSFPQSHTPHIYHFLKGWLRQNSIYNLESF